MFDAVLPLVYAGGATLMAALTVYAWRRREVAGSRPLAGLLGSLTWWLVASLGAELAGSAAATMRWGTLAFVGLGGTVAFLFVFALRYAGHDDVLAGRRALVLAVHPVAIGVLSLTNAGTGVDVLGVGGHELVYRSMTTTSVGPADIDWGPGFWVHTAYSYALVAASTVLVARTAVGTNDLYRGQSTTVVAAILVPWVANVLDLAVPGVQGLLVVGFCVAGLLLTVSMYRYDLGDVAPVARPVVMESIADGVVVVDARGRVVDANERACTLLGADAAPVGDPATAVLPAPVESALSSDADRERVELVDRVLDVETAPYPTGDTDDAGTVLVLRDVTEQHAYRTELERQTERLDRFASVVSHDIRNPLGVAQGYADLAAETGDLDHLEQVREAHDRMEALVEDALLLAREGETSTDPEAVGLSDLAERAWSTVDTGDVALSVREDAVLVADPVRSVQLFENCYRNAVEAGAGRVAVGVLGGPNDPDGRGDGADGAAGGYPPSPAGFYVADDGPGIPSEVAEDLFATGVSGGDGTGLGLAIVERIAEAHGWSVAATASADGGARFEFYGVEFPDRAEASVDAQASP